MYVEQDYFVGLQDVGSGDVITNKAIIEAMTNTANLHGKLVGQGSAGHRKLGWVVVRWKLQVFGRAQVCDTVRVRTWAQEYTRVSALRDFTVSASDGTLLAAATSEWMVIDLERRFLTRLSPEMMEPYGPEPERKMFPGHVFPNVARMPVPPCEDKGLFAVPRCMIDCNDHVHNPAYLDIAAEAMPAGLEREQFPNVEVTYKREIRPGQSVALRYSGAEGRHSVYLRDPQDDTLHALVVQY